MDQQIFSQLVQCYGSKGIQIGRSIPLSGDDPYDKFTIIEGDRIKDLSEEEFLRDAKRRGCYHERITFDHLELTEVIPVQEELLCRGLGCNKDQLNVALGSLSEKDAIALTTTAQGRRIGIASTTNIPLTDAEIRLYGELEKYRTRSR